MKDGIMFHPRSPYYKVCADVIVMNKNKIAPHIHPIPTSSKPVSKQESHDSDHAEQLGAPLQTQPLPFPESQQSSLSPSSSQFTTLKRRSAKGFASSAEVVATAAIPAVVTTVPIGGTALITCSG